MGHIPAYLTGYEQLYREDPRAAATAWFREAKYGLFLHYGLYSLLARHEWVQLRERIPVAEYEQLRDRFTADGFDAEAIACLAVEAGMRYVNLTTRHHDSFCLFKSSETDFTSVNSPAGRDLVGELSDACARHGLGLCLYYSHGRDWRHPHAPNNDRWGGSARPLYPEPEPTYETGDDHDLQRYLDFMTAQIRELLTQYGPVAAIWLDGIAVPLHPKDASGTPIADFDPRHDADRFRCQELYDLIHSLQPQVLVSYKQGYLQTEDFFAPEHKAVPRNPEKPMEICTTMCPGSWGYHAERAGSHQDADAVWQTLSTARANGCNLLLNSGPLPDGSLDPEDVPVLRQVGERLRREGFPG